MQCTSWIHLVAPVRRITDKTSPLNSLAIDHKPLTPSMVSWVQNKMALWLYLCLEPILFFQDMIHFISSHDRLDPSTLTSLALHRCIGPSAPSLAQASPSHGPSLRSLDLPFTFTTGPSIQASPRSSSSWSHESMSCLIFNDHLYLNHPLRYKG
jgi:hypothetical protein